MTMLTTDRDYIVFVKPRFTEAEIETVIQPLRAGWLGTGPRVKEFQRSFGDYIGVPHSIAMGSCTAALHVTMVAAGLRGCGAAGLREGDEVITTPMTFAATAARFAGLALGRRIDV